MRRWGRIGEVAVPALLLAAVVCAVGLLVWQVIDRASGDDPIAFAKPKALVLVAGSLLVLWAGGRLRLRRAPTFLYSRVPQLARVRPGWVARFVSLPVVLRAVALALIALALARPRTYRSEDIEIEGIDIVIALDLSRSMEEKDLRRNRLDAGQRTIRSFLERRQNDRIGLVVFAERAMLGCPLTLDYRSLDQIVADLEIGDVPEMGTAIGDGLGLALASLRRSDAASKVVILISDGESNVVSEMDPNEAKEIAVAQGVRVFTILMGLEAGRAPGRSRYAVNPTLLRQIAGETGGIYFNAGDDRELEESFQEVRKTLEKSRYRVKGMVYDELYGHLALPAILLLFLEIGLVLTRWRRFP